jgi:hypothetical protein
MLKSTKTYSILYIGKEISQPKESKDKYRMANVAQIIRSLEMDGYCVTQTNSIENAKLVLNQTKFDLIICENTIDDASDGVLFLKEIATSAKTLLLHDSASDPEGKSKFNIESIWWSRIDISVCAAVELLTQN